MKKKPNPLQKYIDSPNPFKLRDLWLGDLNSLSLDSDGMTTCIGVREPHKDEVDGETVYRAMRIVELKPDVVQYFRDLQRGGFRWIIVQRADIAEGQI